MVAERGAAESSPLRAWWDARRESAGDPRAGRTQHPARSARGRPAHELGRDLGRTPVARRPGRVRAKDIGDRAGKSGRRFIHGRGARAWPRVRRHLGQSQEQRRAEGAGRTAKHDVPPSNPSGRRVDRQTPPARWIRGRTRERSCTRRAGQILHTAGPSARKQRGSGPRCRGAAARGVADCCGAAAPMLASRASRETHAADR